MIGKRFLAALAVLSAATGSAWAAQDNGATPVDLEADQSVILIDEAPDQPIDEDPWEPLNRKTFVVYKAIDDYAVVPIARGYRAITTEQMRTGLRNFLSNAGVANQFINNVLQADFENAGRSLARFAINTAIGFGGVADPAERLGIPERREDFGQTLAVWGAPNGPFLFLPIIGPTTVRDGIGIGADLLIDPLWYLDARAARIARNARFGTTVIAFREPAIETLEDVEKESLDYYSSFRSLYLQSRQNDVLNGETNYEDLPEIDSVEDEEPAAEETVDDLSQD
jgi:phospholipid-binding lipoprotein MlaA